MRTGNIPFYTLESAFGPSSLGILVVKDLPTQFSMLRSTVLSDSSRLANLPPAALEDLARPSAKYLVGWSHGKETLRPGVIDTQKGSYYINCAFYKDSKLQGADADRFPGFEEYTAPNVWPPEGMLPNFRAAVEELIRLIIDTAVLVARACDRYAIEKVDGYPSGYLEHVVTTSTTTKARLLHYFPPDSHHTPTATGDAHAGMIDGVDQAQAESSGSSPDSSQTDIENDDWCATHVDHGCLTGLTSAMFVDESIHSSSHEICELPSSPSPLSGLYIRSRTDETVKVNIPRDYLAFQTGEALELITKGKFRAVPHFVRGAETSDDGRQRVARNTLAVFTQPNLDELVDAENRITFGEFARGVVGRNTAG